MTKILTDAELFDLIARIIEDESHTKAYSIGLIRRLFALEEERP